MTSLAARTALLPAVLLVLTACSSAPAPTTSPATSPSTALEAPTPEATGPSASGFAPLPTAPPEAEAPLGTALGSPYGQRLLGVFDGYVLSGDESSSAQYLNSPDATPLAWMLEGSGEFTDATYATTGTILFGGGSVGGGGLAAADSVVGRVDPQSGELVWAVPVTDSTASSATGNRLLLVDDTYRVLDMETGDLVYDLASLPAYEPYLSALDERGASRDGSEETVRYFSDDFMVLGSGASEGDLPGRFRLVDERGDVTVTQRAAGDPPPPELTALGLDSDDLAGSANGPADGTAPTRPEVTADATGLTARLDGETLWRVDAPDSEVWDDRSERTLVLGPTGDLVVLDAESGDQVSVLPRSGDTEYLNECHDGTMVTLTTAVLTCDSAEGANYLNIVVVA